MLKRQHSRARFGGKVYDFLLKNISLAFFAASGLIFYDGYRSFLKRAKYWIHWQILGEYVAVVWLGTSIYYQWWPSVVSAAIVLVAEVWITAKLWSRRVGDPSASPK
jgi:hypothetical protein